MDKMAPGRYIVAVSGGVDSMVLLDMLRQNPQLDLVVAHVDHGIRPDSAEDAAFVETYAGRHNLQYATTRLQLGPGASEDRARKARYQFLQYCCKTKGADGIVLAHHQDDVIETALLAIVRGTGWRGLAPFAVSENLVRPLLYMSKWQLIGYARKHTIVWREDSTNGRIVYAQLHPAHTYTHTRSKKQQLA